MLSVRAPESEGDASNGDACKGGVCKSKSRAGRGGGVCNSLQGGEANGVGEGCRLVCRGATSTGCF